MGKLGINDRGVQLSSTDEREFYTSAPVTSMPSGMFGNCYCPTLGTSVNLYAMAYAAARKTVEQAKRDRFIASCN